jgi:Fe(3+) dicitrate transport protein
LSIAFSAFILDTPERELFSSTNYTEKERQHMIRIMIGALALALTATPRILFADCTTEQLKASPNETLECMQMETVTILGLAHETRDIAGGASEISSEDLESLATTDIVRALRRVPGTSLQSEDGYGLRPNISIRGTPSERSSRITLLEDNILIAPAPYAAPSAYYFPTFGRINGIEVLKGPASITQGPYTIGGALNMLSTPIPDKRQGELVFEGGSANTWRGHAWYGDSGKRTEWLLESHQWRSDGYQRIDRSDSGTGLDKSDYLAKLSFSSDPSTDIYQRLDIKLQSSEEDSEQSYLGLSDLDFERDPLRRYGLSVLDAIHNEHEQIVVNWRIEPSSSLGFFVTVYNNETQRAWYKTEGIDFDGSQAVDALNRTSWSSVINAINSGTGLQGLGSQDLQAIVNGADTPQGSIQIRNNAREYYSRGIQGGGEKTFDSGTLLHELKFGMRLHEDQEDRMQRNDSYQQLSGSLLLSERGQQGNAGNRIQQAKAWSFFIQDRISLGDWVITPGIRYENIEQERIDFGADSGRPDGRDDTDIKRTRKNNEDFWIPGVGVLYEANRHWTFVGGVHKGFSAPGNNEGVDAEESINYEAGLRYRSGALDIEAIAFLHDYRNLQGSCTASSGMGCEIGDVFNGDAVTIPGLEFMLTHDLAVNRRFSVPLLISYTWMNARFENAIAGSEFFGNVSAGDPVPYIPDHQLFVSLGIEHGPWSAYLSGNLVDSVCTQASCGAFEKTDSSAIVDIGAHYQLSQNIQLYAAVENVTRQMNIAARQPYGARPGKDRSWLLGAKLTFH